MAQINLTHLQAQTLIEALQDNIDGEDVLLTKQGTGDLVVAFSQATLVITDGGEGEET